jgi:sarcosine oxidase
LEPDAGFLLPEKCIRLFLQEALKRSARLHKGESLLHWQRAGKLIRVETTRSVYHTRKLIITAGAWIGELIASLKPILKVTRQLILWVQPDAPDLYLPERFPCWMVAAPEISGAWYGFPYLNGEAFPGPAGMKLALHYPGKETDPDAVDRLITESETRDLLEAVNKYFIPAGFNLVDSKTCLYTNTPDEHFIIDQLPGWDGDVIVGSVCSGHGFKFASAAGEILAELAMQGQTSSPIDFLRLNRFQQ